MAAAGEKKRLRLRDVMRLTTEIMAVTMDIAGQSAFSVKLDFEIAVDKKIKAHNRTSKALF